MKRKILAIVGSALMCAFAAIQPANKITPAYAEEQSSSAVESSNEENSSSIESTFEEKTYVHSDENGTATLVLLSETEFSITIDGETRFGTYTRNGNVLALTIGENTLEVELNEELNSFGEPSETVSEEEQDKKDFIEEVNKKFNDLINTFVVPLISSVSIASLLSMGFSILFAIKNRGTNKKIKESNDNTQSVALKCVELANDSQKLLVNSIQDLTKIVNEVKEIAKESKAINEETVKKFEEKMSQFENSFEKVLNYADKLEAVEKCVIMLVQLQCMLAKADPKAISSGVIEQIDMLNEQAKKLL